MLGESIVCVCVCVGEAQPAGPNGCVCRVRRLRPVVSGAAVHTDPDSRPRFRMDLVGPCMECRGIVCVPSRRADLSYRKNASGGRWQGFENMQKFIEFMFDLA